MGTRIFHLCLSAATFPAAFRLLLFSCHISSCFQAATVQLPHFQLLSGCYCSAATFPAAFRLLLFSCHLSSCFQAATVQLPPFQLLSGCYCYRNRVSEILYYPLQLRLNHTCDLTLCWAQCSRLFTSCRTVCLFVGCLMSQQQATPGQAWYGCDLQVSILVRLPSYCSKHLWSEQLVEEDQLTSICYVQICVCSSSYGEVLR